MGAVTVSCSYLDVFSDVKLIVRKPIDKRFIFLEFT